MFRCVQTYFIEKYPYTVYSLIFSLILTVSVIVFDVKTVSEIAHLVILKQMALYILFVPPGIYGADQEIFRRKISWCFSNQNVIYA